MISEPEFMSEQMSELNDKRTGQRHLADHLANERTHLAWLRTSFSLIVLGIAINRFSRYLSELQPQRVGSGLIVDERRLGFGMVVFGMLLMLWATIRYSRVSRRIDRDGKYPPVGVAIWVITLAVLLMGSASLTWLFWR